MDYIDGQNLNDYVKSHYVDAEDAVGIIKSVADALIYMHEEKHMLHLDLKPSNVMRRNDGHVFLIDFGLSKHYGDDGQPETSTTIGLGTAGYAPIEQANRTKTGEFRPTIDVYALGATLYKLLTRETPPDASVLVSDEELLANKLREKKVSDNLFKIVTEAMCPNVKKRIQSVREFVYALTGSATHTINSISAKPSEEETVVVNKETKTTDGEETVVTNKNTDNSKIFQKNEINEDSCVGKEQVKESSNRDAKFIISFFVLAVVFTFIFLGFRGCEVNHTAAPAANADSDTVMVEDAAIDCDSVAMYVENKTEIFFGETVRYTGNVFTDPYPGRFYPCDNGKMIFSDGRIYEWPFNRGRMEGDNATFTYPNGDKFIGSFYDNHFYEGTYTVKETGEKFVGTFDNNGQPQRGSWYDVDGNFLQNV